MPGTGQVVFFTTATPSDSRQVFRQLCTIAEVNEFRYLSMYIDHSWDALRFHLGEATEEIEPYQNESFSLERKSVIDITAMIQQDYCIYVNTSHSAFDSLINAGVGRVPESLRNGFLPGNFSVRIGPHHIFEAVGEVIYFGKAMVSVSFDSAHTPNDWEGTRRAIYESPEIQEIVWLLEPVMGKVEVCAFWDI